MKHVIFESKDFYKDYEYAVILTRTGNRCGYVRLPSTNPFYGEHYDDIPYECHGGLTLSGDHLPTLDPSDEYWVGFHCAHYGDAPDVDGTEVAFPDLSYSELEWLEMRLAFYDNGKVWSTEDVIKECKHIIDQIIEQEGEKEGMNQSLKIPGYASFGEVSRMTGLNTTKISNLVKARILETDNFYTLKLIKLESVPHDLSKNTYDRYISVNKKGL